MVFLKQLFLLSFLFVSTCFVAQADTPYDAELAEMEVERERADQAQQALENDTFLKILNEQFRMQDKFLAGEQAIEDLEPEELVAIEGHESHENSADDDSNDDESSADDDSNEDDDLY